MQKNVYVPPEGPPTGPPPSPEIFAAMGEAGLFAMLAQIYDRLAESAIGHMFPKEKSQRLAASRRSAAFFIQMTGGPPLYEQQFGPPRMRARHLPFSIDEAARDEWLRCFVDVLKDAPARYGFPRQHLSGFTDWLTRFAAWMVNQQG